MVNVVIVNYGVGNLFNVERALRALGATTSISHDHDEIRRAERILLPGVGAFAAGMDGLRKHNLVEVLRKVTVTKKTPILGICLGMQLLMERSEENGNWDGLGLIPGEVKRLSNAAAHNQTIKIPQIGWNSLERPTTNKDWEKTIVKGIAPSAFVYFVHSYHVVPTDKETIVAETIYGENRFCSVITNNHIYGCQFHPERSGEAGLKILQNFLEIK